MQNIFEKSIEIEHDESLFNFTRRQRSPLLRFVKRNRIKSYTSKKDIKLPSYVICTLDWWIPKRLFIFLETCMIFYVPHGILSMIKNGFLNPAVIFLVIFLVKNPKLEVYKAFYHLSFCFVEFQKVLTHRHVG